MTQPARTIQWPVWIGAALVLVTLAIVFLLVKLNASLARSPAAPVIAHVPEFTLTNHHGHAVTRADLLGRVWVADIIFTRCPGPCAMMTRQMKQLQDMLPAKSRAQLVSLTTDPDFDTPPILKTYAERFGADSARWMFLTGTKREIANLAIDGLKLTAIEKAEDLRENPDDLFIHSTIFVVVDKRGQLRGVFETTGPDVDADQARANIIALVKTLERES